MSAPQCRDWIFGDIEVKEDKKLHTYQFAMLLSFRTLDDFQAARKIVEPMLFGDVSSSDQSK
jgi:hypothetical protein